MKHLALALALGGCAIVNPDYYRTMSTAEICHGLLTLPSMNLNHPARLRELERRGQSCGSYADVAASQQRADQTYLDNIQRTLPPPTAPVNCTSTTVGQQTYTNCR